MARALLAIRIGQGGFQKLFVVKQLRVDLCDDPEYIEMFLNEARLAALLNHPNVVQTHEIGEDTSSHYISMEYLEGQPLGRIWQKVFREKRGFPLEQSVRVLSEVLSGLHHAHELTDLHGNALSLVHRDISPGNVFITYAGQVKLLDFGIAKTSASGNTEIGVLKGKLSYMAPEQAKNEGLDRRTDIFAIGVLLWEAIAGRRLVPRSEVEPVTFHNRIAGNWESIREVKPDAPSELVLICERAMAVEPEDRYQTAKEMRAALVEYLKYSDGDQSAESLGKLVAELFEGDRAKVAKAVTDTIANDKALAGKGMNSDDPTNLIDYTAASSTPVSLGKGLESITLESEDSGVDIQIITGESPIIDDKAGLRRYWPFALVGVAALVTLFVLTRGDDAATSQPVAVSEPQSPSIDASSRQPVRTEKNINLSVSVSPADAIIKLDGEVLSNPFEGKRLQTSDAHQLEVSADGYKAESRIVRFQEDGKWEIALVPLAATPLPPTVKTGGKERNNFRKRERDRREEVDQKVESARKKQEAELERQRLAKLKAQSDRKNSKTTTKMGDDLRKNKQIDTRVIERDNPYK